MGTSIKTLTHVLESELGCELDKGGDHVRYILRVNGRVIAMVKYSRSWRGNAQISDEILSLQAKSMKCSNKTWKLLLQGSITKKEYFQELFTRKEINQAEFDILCGNK